MEEALHLDGVQFADESVMGTGEEEGRGGGAASAVECMEYMEDHHMMMDTGADEIVGLGLEVEYEVGGCAGGGGDMPALGGEEEVLTLHTSLPSHAGYYAPALSDIVTTSSTCRVYQHTQLPPMKSDAMEVEQLMSGAMSSLVAGPASVSSPVKQEFVTFSSAQLQPRTVTLAAAQAQPAQRSVQTTAGVRGCSLREVAIAPKPSSMSKPHSAGFQSAGKPWTQAPKLVPISKGGVVKKLAIGGLVQGKTSTVIGQLGKQLVMVGGGGDGGGGAAAAGGARLKLLPTSAATTSAGGTIHYIKTKPAHQTVVIPAGKPGGAANPILTKMLVHGPGGAGDAQTVLAKIVPAAGGGGGAPRYITLQQHLQAGGGRGGPGKPVLRVKPRTQHIISLKSPPKLVPVSTHGVVVGGGGAVTTATTGTTKKLVLTGGAAQNVVLKSGGVGGTRIHQINVPGKGVQYIRLVTPPSQGAGRSAPAGRTQAAPPAAAAPSIITLPPSKTLLLPDAHASKQQQNVLVRIAPVSKHQTLLAATSSTRGATRPAQSLLAPLTSARAAPAAAAAVAAPVKTEAEDSKASLQELVADMNMNDQHQLPIEYDGPKSVPEAEEQESEPAGKEEGEEEGVGESAGEVGEELEGEEEVYNRGEGGGVDPAHDYGSILHATYVQMHKEKMEAEVLLQSGHAAYAPTLAHQSFADSNGVEMELRPRKACNCTKSQCLKLYCDCFANGEFCHQCNCTNCHNNLENEELRQKAIRSCLDRNPNAFRPKIGKGKSAVGPEPVRIHNKGCNCKRSGCLKNYCECYEAKIACSSICRCIGCRNVEDCVERGHHRDGSWTATDDLPPLATLATFRPPPLSPHTKQPCSFMTTEVIEAVCQCLLAAGAAAAAGAEAEGEAEEARDADAEEARVPAVLGEFSRCLQDIIGAARHAQPSTMQA